MRKSLLFPALYHKWAGRRQATVVLVERGRLPYDEARIAAWANDTHELGIKAYQLLPAGTPDHNDAHHPVAIGNDYATEIKPSLDAEMAKGAARLKAILEDALGGP